MNHFNAAAQRQHKAYREPVAQRIKKYSKIGLAVSSTVAAIAIWRMLAVAPSTTQQALFEGKVVNNIYYNSISKEFSKSALAEEIQNIRDMDSSVPKTPAAFKKIAPVEITVSSKAGMKAVSGAEDAMNRAGFVLAHTRIGYSDSFWGDFVNSNMGSNVDIGDLPVGIMKSEKGGVKIDARQAAAEGTYNDGPDYIAAVKVHEAGHRQLGDSGNAMEGAKSPLVFRIISSILGSKMAGQFDTALSIASSCIGKESKATVYSYRFLDALAKSGRAKECAGIYERLAVNVAQWRDFSGSLNEAAYAISGAIAGVFGAAISALMLIGVKIKEKIFG
ncbi:MAG: hypothetical protein WC506_01655 [Candidatus Micrarchaeia archaeon]